MARTPFPKKFLSVSGTIGTSGCQAEAGVAGSEWMTPSFPVGESIKPRRLDFEESPNLKATEDQGCKFKISEFERQMGKYAIVVIKRLPEDVPVAKIKKRKCGGKSVKKSCKTHKSQKIRKDK